MLDFLGLDVKGRKARNDDRENPDVKVVTPPTSRHLDDCAVAGVGDVQVASAVAGQTVRPTFRR